MDVAGYHEHCGDASAYFPQSSHSSSETGSQSRCRIFIQTENVIICKQDRLAAVESADAEILLCRNYAVLYVEIVR